jgi:hypothetical protein
MSTIPAGSDLIATMESTGLTIEAERATNAMKLAKVQGKDEDSALCKIHERPGHGRGETITHYFQTIDDDQDIHGEESQVFGNEQTDSYLKDSFSSGYGGWSAGLTNVVMEQQRVVFALEPAKRRRIATSVGYRFEKWFMAHLTGDTVANTEGGSRDADLEYVGFNTVTAQDAGHIIYAPGTAAHTTAAAVGGDDTALFSLDLINRARTRAASKKFTGQSYAYSPCETPFGLLYVCFCDLLQWEQLMSFSSDGDIKVLEQAKIEGGFDLEDNAIVSGQGGIYLDTLILVSDFMPKAVESSARVDNTRVASFCGAGALDMGFGEGYTDGNHLGLSVEKFHRRWSLLVDTVVGIKRRIVNGESWACHNIVTYSEV